MKEKHIWWKEAVVYQIYPKSFNDSNGDGIGDINGIIQKLDYLKFLGIDVIWISPIYKSPNADNGYDISDYQDIMNEFGKMDDFDLLLKESHLRGIKIIMDLVVNHTSDEHPWFIESKKSKDNPYRDYYIWKEGTNGQEPNNWGSWFGGPAWEYSKDTGMYYLHIFSSKQPDLNWRNSAVRQDVYRIMRWWLDKGIDGFRLDAISVISKPEDFPNATTKNNSGLYGDLSPFCLHGPHIHDYLKEMNEKVLSKYDVFSVGEASGVTLEEAKKYAGYDRNELNMVFQFEHVEMNHGKYGKWNNERFEFKQLKQIFKKWQEGLEGCSWNALFWSNHDQPRCVSRFGDDDKYWDKSAKMLATCLYMMKGTPFIYQGEEIGMTNAHFHSLSNYEDLESLNAYDELVNKLGVDKETMMDYLQNVSRDNARTPMQWSSQPNAGFTSGNPWIKVNNNYKQINVENQMQDNDSILNYYRKIIQLRKQYPEIIYGSFHTLLDDSNELFAFERKLNNTKIYVICNFSARNVVWNLIPQHSEILISNYDDRISHNIRPYEAVVFKMDCDSIR